ncbi:MAG: hypothetical protein ACPGNT_03675 [Rhodospirillales bacterium]
MPAPVSAFFQAVALALAVLVIASGGAAAQCPLDRSGVVVTLDLLNGQVRHDFTLSADQLASLNRNRGRARIPAGWLPTGLTLTEIALHLETRVLVAPLPDGRFCAVLDTVRAQVGHERFDVYVVNTYPPGSCEHLSVLRHEETHVAIFRDVLRREVPKIRSVLEREARSLGPITLRDPSRAADRLQNRLKAHIMPLFDAMNAQQARQNARLDTPENYAREQKACSGW